MSQSALLGGFEIVLLLLLALVSEYVTCVVMKMQCFPNGKRFLKSH